jgi:hypothetical protein
VARAVAVKALADVVIVDIAAEKAQGIALDILQACPIDGSDSQLIGTSDYALTAGSDVVVVTSGVPRKPGMSRDDLLQVNYKIMQSVTEPGTSPRKFVTPNLTPDPATGRIANWTEEIFIARARTGKGAEGSPMPWANYARMTDDDLRAIYRYLRSLPPLHNNTGDSVRPVEVATR